MANHYHIEPLVSRGLEPICGWDWLKKHQHDLDNWHPTIEITRPGGSQTITIKSKEAMNAACQSMRR